MEATEQLLLHQETLPCYFDLLDSWIWLGCREYNTLNIENPTLFPLPHSLGLQSYTYTVTTPHLPIKAEIFILADKVKEFTFSVSYTLCFCFGGGCWRFMRWRQSLPSNLSQQILYYWLVLLPQENTPRKRRPIRSYGKEIYVLTKGQIETHFHYVF